MAGVDDDRSMRAEQQRTRRLAKRTCGHCGEPADAMMSWGNRQVAICSLCQLKLDSAPAPTPWCAFNEVHPSELRPQATLMPVPIEATLLPSSEPVAEEPIRSIPGRLLRAAWRIIRPRKGRRTLQALSGESD